MTELNALYAQMGISPAVYAYGEAAISRLRERFDAIDQVAEYNQAKVLQAFRRDVEGWRQGQQQTDQPNRYFRNTYLVPA